MKKIYYIISVLLLVVSCTTKQSTEINTVNLIGTQMEAETAPFMKLPFRVNVCNSKLIVLDLCSDSCYYHVLDYPSLNYLYSVGKRGDGPDEITLSTPFQVLNDKLYVFDGAKGVVFIHDLENGVCERRISTSLKSSIDFVCKDDSTFYIEDMTGRHRFWEWTTDGMSGFFNIPKSKEESKNPYNTDVWRGYMAYNSHLQKLAFACQFGDVIEIYDMQQNSAHVVVKDEEAYPIDFSNPVVYEDIQWVKDEIYVLYSNRTDEEKDSRLRGSNTIRVLDEYGNLKMQYTLDMYINGFCVDLDNHTLIGVTSNTDEPFYKWTLPE